MQCLYSIIVTVNGLTIGVSMCMVGVLVPMLEEEEDERLRVDLKTGSRIGSPAQYTRCTVTDVHNINI